jgi:hypothetical protein
VHHILAGDRQDLVAPARDRGGLRRVQALVGRFRAEGGMEIDAHQVVLDLGGRRQAGNQRFAGAGKGESSHRGLRELSLAQGGAAERM